MNTPRRGPKTKASNADIKNSLLAAGARLFGERAYSDVSVREIAEEAGVTQAMLRYYFGDKNSFAIAVLDHGMQQFLAVLDSAEQEELQQQFYNILKFLNATPWLVRMVVRDVHLGDELRAYFLATYVPKLLGTMQQKLAAADVAVDGQRPLSVLATMAMLLFPQIIAPAITEVLKIELEDEYARQMAAQIVSMLTGSK